MPHWSTFLNFNESHSADELRVEVAATGEGSPVAARWWTPEAGEGRILEGRDPDKRGKLACEIPGSFIYGILELDYEGK